MKRREKEEVVQDRAYDEAIPVETDDEDEEVSTPASSEPGSPAGSSQPQSSPAGRGNRQSPEKSPRDKKGDGAHSDSGDSSSGEGSSTSDSSTGGGDQDAKNKAAGVANGYNPDDFRGMKVSAEVEELFQYITRYKPHTIDLDSSLKPFIPELIPSIGEVDAFLKMPRPDDHPDGLGTTRLDEPAMNPSDPSILDLQLRSLSKAQDLEPMEVRSIENAEKCPKEIENWVKRIDSLNRSKPAPTVQYSRRMPDIETLMQVWPAEFEDFLQQNVLPDLVDLDLDLPSYIKIIASILDVPVHNQLTETLHVIFTLYSEFKSNQHFSKTENTGNFVGADQYNFGPMPNFAQGASAAGATGPVFTGSNMDMAPSRAPSPVHD